MAGATRLKLSGSTDGRLIKIAATGSPGTTIHTAHASDYDEVYLWAVNSDTTARWLLIENQSVGEICTLTIPPESGLVLVLPGIAYSNSMVLAAYAETANVIMVGGWVRRYSSSASPTSVYAKRPLTQSISGYGTLAAATSTPGTTINLANSTTEVDEWDEIWVWASNSHTAPVKLTIEYGGTTAPDDLIEMTIPNDAGLTLVVPGLILHNTLSVRAFAATGSVVRLVGYVNRITTP